MKRAAFAIVVLLVLTLAQESRAADPLEDFPDPAAAQNLVVEAHGLIEKSRYAEACPKLEESLRLVPDIGTRLDLADCNAQLGNIATAWTDFLEVAARSKDAHQTDRERLARKRARALEARLPKLVIVVPQAPEGIEVKRDGIAVLAAAWGTEVAVDPGKHRVTVTAPGKQRWVTTVQSTEGTTTRVEVPRELPASPDAMPMPPAQPMPETAATTATTTEVVATPVVMPPAPPPGPSPEVSSVSPLPPLSVREDLPRPALEEPRAKRRTLAWLVAGAGAVGLGMGAGFALSSLESREDSRSQCAGDFCNATGVSQRDDAIRSGNVATVATVVGAAALAGGLFLLLTAPKRFEKR